MTRFTALAIPLLLFTTGCARDIILKPAASSFVTDARSAVSDIDKLYAGVISDLNERNVRLLVDNPECGLNTEFVVRTPEADALLKSAGRTPGTSLCLTSAEIQTIGAGNSPAVREALSARKRLVIPSLTDFTLRTATVRRLTDYVAVLADAMDDPKLTVAADIKDVGSGVLALGQSADSLRTAFTGSDSTAMTKLVADKGPIDQFTQNLAALGGAIEVIADQAKDVKTLDTAIKKDGKDISRLIRDLAGESDRWSCLQAQMKTEQAMLKNDQLRAGYEALPADRREAAVRAYLAAVQTLDVRCVQAGSAPPFTTVGQMLSALAVANDDLIRIANGNLTPAERRREAAETMRRLSAVFKAIASTAMVVL